MRIRTSRCSPVFAVLLLAAASSTALPAQQPAMQEEAVQAAAPAAGETPGTRTLTAAEQAAVRQAAAAPAPPPPAIKPAQVHPGDHVASGISLHNRGGGVINLRGAPAGATPLKALLYWDVLVNTAAPTMTVSVNGVAVNGTKIGQGPSPCWPGASLNAAYQADVPLYLLYIGINGDYQIAGVPSSIGTGDNPFLPPFTAPMAEGATLVVIYRHPNNAFSKTYIYEAPISGNMFSTTFNTTLGGFNPTAPLTQAKLTLIGSNGQIGGGFNATYSTTAEKSFFQGQQIAGPGSTNNWVDNDSDWNGQDTEPLSQLWDTRTHVVPIKKGSPDASVSYTSQGDCLVTVAFVLSL